MDLKSKFVRNTFREILLLTKTLKSWRRKSLKTFRIQLSYWLPELSFGQTPSRLQLATFTPLQQSTPTAHQPVLDSLPASSRKRQTNSTTKKRIFTSLIDSIDLSKYKIRLFNGLYTFWENKRLRWGMILLMIVAPLVKFAYLAFPENGFGEFFLHTKFLVIPNTIEGPDTGWYWGLVRIYVFSNGELLAPVISIIGMFFLFPQRYYPSYLIGVPFGYYAGLSFHRLFFVNSLETFHASWPLSISLMFIILGVAAFIISDKVLFQQNHVKRAHEARMVGLINMPGMDWSDKEDLIKKEAKELMKVDNELFIKESA